MVGVGISEPAGSRVQLHRYGLGEAVRFLLPQLPRRAKVAAQQLRRFGVALNFLASGIPFELATDQHRDQAQVAGNGRMMGGFGRRDRGLPRFDASKEVAVMIARLIELHFAQRIRQFFVVAPFLVG
jgi:hypothetical protein